MDKVLTLIVAATVLMIAAVTLIFSTTDSLGGFGDTANTSSQICDVYKGEYNDAQDEGDTEEIQRITEKASEQGCAWA
jgi:cell division protein FtsL